MEKDPVRGEDSFNSFEEILKEAVKHNVSEESWPKHKTIASVQKTFVLSNCF